MPNLSVNPKGGNSVGISSLLEGRKRNTTLAVQSTKNAGLNNKTLIKQKGFNTGFLDNNSKRGLDSYNAKGGIVISATESANGGFLGRVRVFGYNIGSITQLEIDAFKVAFAAQYNISPSLITITLSPGSLIVNISALPVSNVSALTPSEKSFFANSGTIISGIQPATISNIIAQANIPPSSIYQNGPLSIDPAFTQVNNSLDLKTLLAQDPSLTQNLYSDFPFPFVGDPVNNCMYTLIPGEVKSSIVRVNINGTIDKICDHAENNGCSNIFLTTNSTHLIIPSNIEDTRSPSAQSTTLPYCNKVYLVNILTKNLVTITLTDLILNTLHGYDKSLERFYYSSAMASNFRKLCYVTIPTYTPDATILPIYFTGIVTTDIDSIGVKTIEFVNSKTAYASGTFFIAKLDLTGVGSLLHFVGRTNDNTGRWSTPDNLWSESAVGGPYLDATDGTNAQFSSITSISYDSANNRLLVIDAFALRIRAIDLTPGGTYAVSTLAGTSPTFLGLAINSQESTYSAGQLQNLAQVGLWSNTFNAMPEYVKFNRSYLTSTFNFFITNPSSIISFNDNIFVIGSKEFRRLVNGNVSDFKTSFNTNLIQPVINEDGGLIGSIKLNGYTIQNLIPNHVASFKSVFAQEYGINPNLISIKFSGQGFLVLEFFASSTDVSKLTNSDKSFFANADAVIRGIHPSTISSIILRANIPSTSISIAPSVSLDTASTIVNTNLDIITKSKNDSTFIKNTILQRYALSYVADTINNCMYSVIFIPNETTTGVVVKINANGSMNKLCNYPENAGSANIFINSDSTYLIIPSNLRDTISPDTMQPNSKTSNKIYLVEISTGVIKTIKLTELPTHTTGGFDKATRRFYYSSCMALNYLKLCYVTIPSDYSSTTLTATYLNNVIWANANRLEVIDSNTAYLADPSAVYKIDLSVPNGSSVVIAGFSTLNRQKGGWTNHPGGWYNFNFGGPYLDGPIGTNAFFCNSSNISYDSVNNRLFVVDVLAQRIRSIDLTPGNNYAVTTFVGTSPTFSGLAYNTPSSTFSQSVLDSVVQVGGWGANLMPNYTKVLGLYSSATFNSPLDIIQFNKKIYLITYDGVKQLSNGYVSDFINSYNSSIPIVSVPTPLPIPAAASFIGSFTIDGYTLGTITPEMLSKFTIAFASFFNINPDLLDLSLSAGSLVTTINTKPIEDISALSSSDLTFLANSASIIDNITTEDVSKIVTKSALPSSAIQQTGPLRVNKSSTITNPDSDIVSKAAASPAYTKTIYRGSIRPLVADRLNNCLYTFTSDLASDVPASEYNPIPNITKIDVSGNITILSRHLEDTLPINFFINFDSSFLIIPSYVNDTISPDAFGQSPKPNKIYLFNISTREFRTIILNDVMAGTAHGFDVSTRRFYYSSYMRGSYKFEKLCYVTIPASYSDTSLSATYFSLVSVKNNTRIEFANSTTAYISSPQNIFKLDLSTTDGRSEIIAGLPAGNISGGWTNTSNLWYSYPYYGPFSNSLVGTDSSFSLITRINLDKKNNRLLVCDDGAHRITSIDLTPGNNYSVTTLAGTSLTTSDVARNANGTNFSSTFLRRLLQVGYWGVGNMPQYTKINGTFIESTFDSFFDLVSLNDKIFVTNNAGELRQLLDGYVVDSVVVNDSVNPTIPIGGDVLGRITFRGYSVGPLTSEHVRQSSNKFAQKFGVNPDIINASFSSGSPVFTITSIATKDAKLSIIDKVFFANIDAIIRGIQEGDIANIIQSSEILSTIITISANPSIIQESIYVNTELSIISLSQNDADLKGNRVYTNFNRMVSDTLNNCLYTSEYITISGQTSNSIVKIFRNGTVRKICDYPNQYAVEQIAINSESTYLIIPQRDPSVTKIDLINISTGVFSTLTLTTPLELYSAYGYDQSNRRYYYCSKTNSKLCYVTIPADFSSATLAATFFNNISISNTDLGKIEFFNSTTAYVSNPVNIRRLDLSTANGSSTLIAGFDRTQQDGYWESFAGNQVNAFNSESSFFWYTNSTDFGAYLDAPIGTNAFFGSITDIKIDVPNNRLLVVDQTCHRIRSVDLTPGNNYAVTTFAGTSPVFKGLARNAYGTTFSQSVLDSLGQIGRWGANNMPEYTSTNSSFLSSTFYSPGKIILLNNRFYVLNDGANYMKQLSNGSVSDFVLVQDTSNIEMAVYYNDEIVPLATIRVDGYNFSSLTPTELSSMKAALAARFGGVNPELLVLVPRSGSLIMDISVDYGKITFNKLTDNDKIFFANSDSILNSLTSSTISSIITAANIGGQITRSADPVIISTTIQNATDSGESNYKLKSDCLNYLNNYSVQNFTKARFPHVVVGDPINNCIYTILNSELVQISNNGTSRRMITLPFSIINNCKFMFINSSSTHLIIPYFGGQIVKEENIANSLIYLIKIDGYSSSVFTISLIDLDGGSTYGFDKSTNRLYYCSALAHPTKKRELCFITISNYNEDSRLSATFNFSNLKGPLNDLSSKGKIEFANSTTAYFKERYDISKVDLSVTGGAITSIAGQGNLNGSEFWTNIYPNISWNTNSKFYAPYLDGNGTNAFFSYIQDISYDSVNNRLLVCDLGAQRIRSVDLSGNTYAVTTLAGTSPLTNNVSGKLSTSYNYKQNVLDRLNQIGAWNNGVNDMPIFRKTNKTYLTSTFKYPVSIINFNNNIYLRTLDALPYDDISLVSDNIEDVFYSCTLRYLCNNKVSDFDVFITNSLRASTSALQLSTTNLVSSFTNPANSSAFFTSLESSLQTAPAEIVNVTSKNLIDHYSRLPGIDRTAPSTIYALSGTNINQRFINNIRQEEDAGFLIPSSYPITIDSSSYQSNSSNNTLTKTTNGVVTTINSGEIYQIGNSSFFFLGTTSPGLSIGIGGGRHLSILTYNTENSDFRLDDFNYGSHTEDLYDPVLRRHYSKTTGTVRLYSSGGNYSNLVKNAFHYIRPERPGGTEGEIVFQHDYEQPFRGPLSQLESRRFVRRFTYLDFLKANHFKINETYPLIWVQYTYSKFECERVSTTNRGSCDRSRWDLTYERGIETGPITRPILEISLIENNTKLLIKNGDIYLAAGTFKLYANSDRSKSLSPSLFASSPAPFLNITNKETNMDEILYKNFLDRNIYYYSFFVVFTMNDLPYTKYYSNEIDFTRKPSPGKLSYDPITTEIITNYGIPFTSDPFTSDDPTYKIRLYINNLKTIFFLQGSSLTTTDIIRANIYSDSFSYYTGLESNSAILRKNSAFLSNYKNRVYLERVVLKEGKDSNGNPISWEEWSERSEEIIVDTKTYDTDGANINYKNKIKSMSWRGKVDVRGLLFDDPLAGNAATKGKKCITCTFDKNQIQGTPSSIASVDVILPADKYYKAPIYTIRDISLDGDIQTDRFLYWSSYNGQTRTATWDNKGDALNRPDNITIRSTNIFYIDSKNYNPLNIISQNTNAPGSQYYCIILSNEISSEYHYIEIQSVPNHNVYLPDGGISQGFFFSSNITFIVNVRCIMFELDNNKTYNINFVYKKR